MVDPWRKVAQDRYRQGLQELMWRMWSKPEKRTVTQEIISHITDAMCHEVAEDAIKSEDNLALKADRIQNATELYKQFLQVRTNLLNC